MKKGKTTKLSGYRSFKSHYGTIDAQNLKSIYVNIQTWVEPKDEVENWSRVVMNMERSGAIAKVVIGHYLQIKRLKYADAGIQLLYGTKEVKKP